MSYPLGIDVHSYANFHEAKTTHLYPHLVVDFTRQTIHGYTDITALVLLDNVEHILLDTRGVVIEKCVNLEDNTPLLFTLPRHHPVLGVCLSVPIPQNKRRKGTTYTFRVYHNTTSASTGIQWFEPNQTLGKKYPFCYTQFQAILARTMLPCQDTPAVKCPYTMEVAVPAPLVAACSGSPVGEATETTVYGVKHLVYKYNQKIPIPSYLIALAAGDLKRAPIGPRSYVWCEQELIEASKYEFEETETFLQAGEKICGVPYDWTTYDILVLPGAFPYGGMENPNLTFLSSSLITGDRALTDVVAHEIVHSWAGNYVTNASWTDFFLNEGFTMYIERLILGAVHGEKYRHFEELLGYGELVKTVTALQDEPELTKLRPNLVGMDPDDAFSRIPYEKGCLFLFYLEKLVGGKEVMISWLQTYFNEYAKKSLDAEEMKAHFLKFFESKNLNIDWDHWFYGVGLPNYNPKEDLDQSYFSKCEALMRLWKEKDGEGASANDIKWGAGQTMAFLDLLINEALPMKPEVLKKMDEVYQLSKSNNVEVLIRWYLLHLQSNNLSLMPAIEEFVSKHGRGVYIKPTYTTLIKLAQNGLIEMEKVKAIYKKNRNFYHAVIRNMFDSKLNE